MAAPVVELMQVVGAASSLLEALERLEDEGLAVARDELLEELRELREHAEALALAEIRP